MTIGIILGFLFAALAMGGGALAVWGSMKKKKRIGRIGAVGAVAFLLLFILVPFSFHTVEAGEVAVVKHMGKARGTRQAGTYFDFWITEKYELYDAKLYQAQQDAASQSPERRA